MPDYTTLSTQIELFKTKINTLTSSTLTAYDLTLMASALNTLAEALGVNDISALTNTSLDQITAAKTAAIAEINSSANGTSITNLQTASNAATTSLNSLSSRVTTVETINTNQTGLISAVENSAQNSGYANWVSVTTGTVSAINGSAFLCFPVAPNDIIVTLPSSPATGAKVKIYDANGTSFLNNIRINTSGISVQGVSGNIYLNKNWGKIELLYINPTAGWTFV